MSFLRFISDKDKTFFHASEWKDDLKALLSLIFEYAQTQNHLEVGWVWNRSLDKLVDLDEDLILEDLEDIDDMPKKVYTALFISPSNTVRVDRLS